MAATQRCPCGLLPARARLPRILRGLLACLVAFAFLTVPYPAAAVAAAGNRLDAAAAGTHVVARGDTLYSIALRYGTTVEEIRRINRLPHDIIYVGQVLDVGLPAPTPTAAAGATIHTVVRGDTLFSLARRYGTTVDALMAANHLADTLIYVDQRLFIPSAVGTPGSPLGPSGTPTPTVTPTPTPTPTGTLTPGGVVIESVSARGTGEAQADEYVVIRNNGSASQNLSGWRLFAGDPGQDYFFLNLVLAPGQSCRVYTNEVRTDSCEQRSFEINEPIWDNDDDFGRLFDASDALIDEYVYP